MFEEFLDVFVEEGPLFVGWCKIFTLCGDFSFFIATIKYDHHPDPERLWSGGIQVKRVFSEKYNKIVFKKELFDNVEIVNEFTGRQLREFYIDFRECQFGYVYDRILHILENEGAPLKSG